jgi:hypothetical protein
MANYSYSMRGRVSRGAGKSSVGAAAYLCREQMRDQRTGQIFDWRQPERGIAEASAYLERSAGDHNSRQELLFSGLYGPAGAPELDARQKAYRGILEPRRGRGTPGQSPGRRAGHHRAVERIDPATERVGFAGSYPRFHPQDRVVQVAIHSGEQDPRNIHAHLLISTRGIDENGFKPTKAREQQEQFLNRREYVNQLRASWEHAANRHLERHGVEQRIDRRSLADQGIDREPGRHMGPAAAWRKQRGLETDRGPLSIERERRGAQRRAAARHAPGPIACRESSRDVDYGHKLNLAAGKRDLILNLVIETGNPADRERLLPMHWPAPLLRPTPAARFG